MYSRTSFAFVLVLAALGLYISGPVGRLLVAGGITLFVPGYVVWSSVRPELRLSRFASPAIWLGLSLSLIPIGFLWSSTIGLRLSPTALRLQLLGLALLALWLWLHRRAQPLPPVWLIISLGFVLGLTALTRWLEIRDVVAPLWVDSLHHTLLVRIIGETGSIPTSLQPYLPVERLVYHWGYHTVIATWQAAANLPLLTAILWSGQILNALIALVMYALGAYMLRSPRAGLLAAGVAGLLSLMPAYYVTWGRYTQLTGLLLLPGLLITSLAFAERPTFSWRLGLITAILIAGLVLVHYRVLAFYVAFMLPYMLLIAVRNPRQMTAVAARFALAGGLAMLLIAPWVVRMIRQVVIPVASSPSLLAGTDSYNSLDWALHNVGNNALLYWLAGAGAVLALLLRHWRALSVASWVGMMLLFANPRVLGLSPSWFINNHSVAITLFIPVGLLAVYTVHQMLDWLRHSAPTELMLVPIGILIGFVGDQGVQWLGGAGLGAAVVLPNELLGVKVSNVLLLGMLQVLLKVVVYGALGIIVAYIIRAALAWWFRLSDSSLRRWGEYTIGAALTGALLFGTWQLRNVVNSVTVLVQAADLKAVDWAIVHTPPDARFLVNTAPWLNGSYRGTDAGWWLLPLGRRWVSTPPALYIYGKPEYRTAVERFNEQVSALRPSDIAQLKQLIRQHQITHVFVGSNPGPIKADMLFGDPDFRPLYDQDGVAIFEVQLLNLACTEAEAAPRFGITCGTTDSKRA